MSSPFQIFYPIISFQAVFVIDCSFIFRIRKKCLSHEPMYLHAKPVKFSARKPDKLVAFLARSLSQNNAFSSLVSSKLVNSQSVDASYSSSTTDLIDFIIRNDCNEFPNLFHDL